MLDGGYRRHCPECTSDHFPRTDPVVIIVVRRQENFLLGRQTSWAKGRYSALAGFMEPGETIEEAVRRAVHEEVGITVGRVRYLASQPWPFPSSLMMGCIAQAISHDITIDAYELAEARWFQRDEVLGMVERAATQADPEGVSLPPPIAIGHQIARRWATGVDS